jgi:dienelactone hydrolase
MKRILSIPLALVSVVLLLATLGRADGPADNQAAKVRPVPPPGIAVPEAEAKALAAGIEKLGAEIESLRAGLKGRPNLHALLPDVEIYYNAVRTALLHHEFFDAREIPIAKKLLDQGMERAILLRDGKAPWTTATGLVVRGYVSRIDGSVQPYGLVVPSSYRPDTPHRFRLDIWCHGRGETLSELNFIEGRQKSAGEFAPPNAFVLHPYGRYCNANKFAGEIDTFEALENINSQYPIDDNRIVMRGFSMGGAACWQFAVHYPGVWAAAAPGAGFSETPDFLRVFQNENVQPNWYERKLWHLYDCTDYAVNLYNCPTVAYSGENDRQKQAADLMARALQREGIELVHIIGAKAGHQYTPEAKTEINRNIDAIVQEGRDRSPSKVVFTTWTLRYNQCHWLRVDELDQHWEQARVVADMAVPPLHVAAIETKNVAAFTIDIPPGRFQVPLETYRNPLIKIDTNELMVSRPRTDRSWTAHFRKVGGKWRGVPSAVVDDGKLRKVHGLQGPIDDAFMGSFLMVRPTGVPFNEKLEKWTTAELAHAVEHWRKQFRGDARVKDDRDISAADIAEHNLVLWGDPVSNLVLTKIAAKLPITWSKTRITLGDERFDATHHVPVMIYPNPLNPRRYVVINSGFTFREYDYLNNARQVPKLPDYAVLDIDAPVSPQAPGRVVAGGFFDELWKLKPQPRLTPIKN